MSSDSACVQQAMQTVWDYMLLHHELRKAEAIMVLGSYDTNVGVYAAQLFLDGWAPLLVCAGSGTVNQQNAAWKDFAGSTEAEVFADIAIKVCTASHRFYDVSPGTIHGMLRNVYQIIYVTF